MTSLKSALLFFTLTISVSAFSQDSEIKSLLDSKRFVFVAESATPMRGGNRILSPGYTLTLSGDTLVSDLPYYGRAFVAPMNPSETGMKFTSVNFEYSIKNKKNKGWVITIKTKDLTSSIRATITVFKNGSASVYINSTDRDSISYNGRVEHQK